MIKQPKVLGTCDAHPLDKPHGRNPDDVPCHNWKPVAAPAAPLPEDDADNDDSESAESLLARMVRCYDSGDDMAECALSNMAKARLRMHAAPKEGGVPVTTPSDPRSGTVCKCGTAKSYHIAGGWSTDPLDCLGYDPRYPAASRLPAPDTEDVSWFDTGDWIRM